MAIEIIQYIYDYRCFYRRALRPVKYQFLKRFQREQQKETTKKIQLKLARKRCRSRKAILGPSKHVQLGLPRTPKIWYRPPQ